MENIELMKGLEILDVSESFPMMLNFILGFLCLIVIVLCLYVTISAVMEGNLGATMLGILFVGISIFLGWTVVKEAINPTITYKVIVDDSVSLNEFYNNYEILSVDGKIYTIKVKEDR